MNRCAGIGCRMQEHMRGNDIDAADIGFLEKSRVTRAYKRNDKIFCQDDVASGIYCIRSGSILLWHVDSTGFRTAFRVAGSCEIIGYRSMFGEDPHAATAQALTACHICYYPKQSIYHLIDRNPGLARKFLRTLARDRGPREALFLRGKHISVRERLIYLLLIMKDQHSRNATNGGLTLQLPVSRQEIGSMIGARPESIARAIKDLKEDGVATFHGRSVVVPELQKLYEECGLQIRLD